MLRCERAGIKAFFVFNDLNDDIVNFFRVLRDPALRQKLLEALRWTPYARAEYITCLEAPPVDDPVERARRFFVRHQQSYGGQGVWRGQWNWRTEADWPGSGPARWVSSRERLERFGMLFQLQSVQIECLDFTEAIQRYDGEKVLMYCDPPYYHNARRGNYLYEHEMPPERHKELAEILGRVRGMAAVSGYRCPEYAAWYTGWQRYDRPVACHLASDRGGRVESLWLNPAAVSARGQGWEQLSLFEFKAEVRNSY